MGLGQGQLNILHIPCSQTYSTRREWRCVAVQGQSFRHILVFRVSGFGFMVQVEGFRFRVQG